MNGLKILLMDMELSYATYFKFPSKKPVYDSPDNIISEQYCVCAAWKWHHETSVYSLSVKKPHDDLAIAKKLHKLFDEADVIVAHNGDAFDIKHANTLFKKHGLTPITDKKTIDTLKLARKYFAFSGNSLGKLLRLFNIGDKDEKPDWKLLTVGDKKEIKKAEKYCRTDVIGLEKIFVELRPFMKNYPTLRANRDRPVECDMCGCKKLHSVGVCWRSGNKFVQRIRCTNPKCGYEHKIPLKKGL